MRAGQIWHQWLRPRLVATTHGIVRLFRGRPKHLLLTGTDLTSVERGVSSFRALFPDIEIPDTAHQAKNSMGDFSPLLTSWSLSDLTDFGSVEASVGALRDLLVIVFISDPRETVSRRQLGPSGQYVDSADYSLDPAGAGLIRTGVLPRFTSLDSLRARPNITRIEIKNHMTGQEKQTAIATLQSFLGSRSATTTEEFSDAVGDVFSREPMWPGKPEQRDRVFQQIGIHPELEKRAQAEGYAPLATLAKTGRAAARATAGTIIAFHTNDEVYRSEAARLKKSLDKLGLRYQFFEVEREGDWARTTLLKPKWMRSARDTISGPLLYIDVDAVVHKDPWPYLHQYTGDLAAVYDYGILNSATILINDTVGAREMLDHWQSLAGERLKKPLGELQQTGEDSDQTVLREIVNHAEKRAESSMTFQRLPLNMAYIFDGNPRHELVGDVYIEQLQASRESTRNEKRLARRRQRLKELGE